MRVTVQFYARLRELTGRRDWSCDLASPATVADVWAAGTREHPGLEAMTGNVSCAVNAEFARMTATVRDGDEVAFLPPVSGGARD